MKDNIIKLLIERRKKARESGRILYNKPLLEDLVNVNDLSGLRKPVFEFLIGVGKKLRNRELWVDAFSSEIVDFIAGKVVKYTMSNIIKGVLNEKNK